MTTSEKKHDPFTQYQEDFAVCEKVIKTYSTTFYKAFSQLPEKKAKSIYAIYAFCREADDAIDVWQDEKRLDRLIAEWELFKNGDVPPRALWRALSVVFDSYDLDTQAFDDLLHGQKMDVTFQQPQTQKELETYCYFVAGTVGLMILPILTQKSKHVRDYAIQLGTAMQLTNILRDIGEDEEHQRVYLPKEIMDRFNYSLDDLAAKRLSPAFKQLWEFEAARAEDLYRKAEALYPTLDEDCRQAVMLAAVFYEGILQAVRSNHYDCLTKRNYVSKIQKLRLYQQVQKDLHRLEEK